MLRLPNKQEIVWELYLKGKKITEIAQKLGISKQAVSLYLKHARAKIMDIFVSLANVMDLDIIKMNAEKGILIGTIRQTDERIFIFYIPKKGPLAIYSGVLNSKIKEDSNCRTVIEFYSKLLNIQEKDLRKVLLKILSFAEVV